MIKCDFIVSNTIKVLPAYATIISNDLNQRHGRYKYEYPKEAFISIVNSVSCVSETSGFSIIGDSIYEDNTTIVNNINVSVVSQTSGFSVIQ